MSLERDGWQIVQPGLSTELLEEARREVFADQESKAGTRCLLDHPVVLDLALRLRNFLVSAGIIPADAVAIQAIAFDKTPGANWKVPWHQDVMFPTAEIATLQGYDLATIKDGVPYARPPLAVLEKLLAARLHLDPCGPDNGPLRVASASHREGLIDSARAGQRARELGEVLCTAAQGELLLMRPLLLHASSQAESPAHRRVLHFVYDEGGGCRAEAWHRMVS